MLAHAEWEPADWDRLPELRAPGLCFRESESEREKKKDRVCVPCEVGTRPGGGLAARTWQMRTLLSSALLVSVA